MFEHKRLPRHTFPKGAPLRAAVGHDRERGSGRISARPSASDVGKWDTLAPTSSRVAAGRRGEACLLACALRPARRVQRLGGTRPCKTAEPRGCPRVFEHAVAWTADAHAVSRSRYERCALSVDAHRHTAKAWLVGRAVERSGEPAVAATIRLIQHDARAGAPSLASRPDLAVR